MGKKKEKGEHTYRLAPFKGNTEYDDDQEQSSWCCFCFPCGSVKDNVLPESNSSQRVDRAVSRDNQRKRKCIMNGRDSDPRVQISDNIEELQEKYNTLLDIINDKSEVTKQMNDIDIFSIYQYRTRLLSDIKTLQSDITRTLEEKIFVI